MSRTLQWGILGTGNIAGTFAEGLAGSTTGKLVAVGSRQRDSAERFGGRFNVPHVHDSYEALLADPQVEAVYISLPHPMHAEWAIKVARAGKHILCEKPIAVNHSDAAAIIEAARSNDVFLMEAFMYRCHPQTTKLVELIRNKAIGDVRVIHAAFSFHAAFDASHRAFNHELGGGGILDVGCYPVSMARLVAGVAMGRDFAEPIDVQGAGHIGKVSRVDEWAIASLRFPGDIVAQVATGVSVNQENVVRIFGSEGNILIPSPWLPSRNGGVSTIILQRNASSQPEEIRIEETKGLYSIEADTVAAHIDRRQAPSPAMTWEDTLGNMKTLDRWRASIGLRYDGESA